MNKYSIRGIGYLAPNGTGYETFVENFKIRLHRGLIEQIDPQGYLGPKGNRFLNKATKMYCNLAFQCLEFNNMKELVTHSSQRIGLYDGSELSNLYDGFMFDLIAKIEGPDLASPMSAPNTIANAASSQMAIKSKIKGPNFSVSGGACGALQALDVASMHLSSSTIDHAVVCSTEVVTPYQRAVRKGEKRMTIFNQSGEQGISLLISRNESQNDLLNDHVNGYLSECTSVQRLKTETTEQAILRMVENYLDSNGNPLFDSVVIGGGGHNINAIMLSELFGQKYDSNIPFFYPEFIYGNGDNAGGFMGILYAIGVFNEDVKPICEFKHGELTTVEYGNKNKPENCLVITSDKTGYCSSVIVSKSK